MNIDELKSWETVLTVEVDRLRKELERKEEELRHVGRLRELQEVHEGEPQHPQPQPTVPKLQRRSGGRRSLAELPVLYLEFDGHRFSTAGKLLDYIGQPHYFSPIRGGKGDTDVRQIIVWAKRNEVSARRVKVQLRDGRSFSLWDIVEASLKA
jgi:hypothetical protein